MTSIELYDVLGSILAIALVLLIMNKRTALELKPKLITWFILVVIFLKLAQIKIILENFPLSG